KPACPFPSGQGREGLGRGRLLKTSFLSARTPHSVDRRGSSRNPDRCESAANLARERRFLLIACRSFLPFFSLPRRPSPVPKGRASLFSASPLIPSSRRLNPPRHSRSPARVRPANPGLDLLLGFGTRPRPALLFSSTVN